MTPSQDRKHKGSILVIDDEPSLKLLFTILTEHGYSVHERQLDLQSEVRFVKDTLPDLVLVDVRKPGIAGYQVAATLKNDPATRAIPVILVSSIDSVLHHARSLGCGAVDYVTDPIDAEEVLWRIETHISLRRLREALGSAAGNHGAQTIAADENLERAFREIHNLSEVTGYKHAEERVRQAARVLKKAEEALQSSQRNLAAIVNTIPTTAWTARPDGYCDFLNQVWLDYAGMTAEQAQGWGWAEAIHPDDRKRLVEAWQSCLASGTPVDTEARIRRFDASYRWFLIRANPLRDESGNILKWYGTCTDIEDRKRAEEALQSSQRDLSLMIDAIPDMIHTARPDGYLDYFNRPWLEYMGCSLSDIEGWNWTARIHPDDLPGIVDKWRACVASGENFEYETRVRRGDGQYRWMFHRKVALRDEHGNIVRWYGTSLDIDDRKRAEAQVAEAYARLAEAQRLSKTGSFITDLLVDDHNWSEEAFRIFEFDPATKVTVQKIHDRVHPEDLPYFDSVIARGMQGIDVDFVFRILTSGDAVKHVRGVARVIEQIAGRPLFIGAFQDVTESKLAEEALNRARFELAHVTRVTTLNALTASIAHEVNQPLSGIVSNASASLHFLSGDAPNLEEAREAIRDIVRDGKRAGEIITRIRALTTRTAAPREKLGLNETISEVLALIGDEAKRHSVIVRTQFADALSPVAGDRVQLQQVVLNLVMNAIEAMSDVGDRPRELVITTQNVGDCVQATLDDSGIGIASDTVDKIFDSFYTTKTSGMGMGLSISRSILQSHGGRLWAVGKDAPGTLFHFTVPKYREEGAHGPAT